MLPPDVEPIPQPRRGDGAGVFFWLFSVFAACGFGYGLRCLVEWVAS